jgi:hypothetical protein
MLTDDHVKQASLEAELKKLERGTLTGGGIRRRAGY